MNSGHASLCLTITSFVLGCGGGGSTTTIPTTEPLVLPTSLSSSATLPPAPARDELGITLVERPEPFVLDGAIGEWGALQPIDPGIDPEAPEEPRAQEPVAVDALGYVGLVVEADGVLVAGELAKPATDAVWIGIGTRPAALPYIGTYGRAAASFDPVVCSEKERYFTDGMYYESETPTPPETLAACKAVIARYDAYAETQNARFSRVIRIDAKGATDVTTAKAAAIGDAKVVWKTSADGTATFEATLPTSSLPRIADAPLMSMRLLARNKELAIPAARWTGVALPLPLSYEPHGELRAELFVALAQHTMPYQPPPGLSFHPSKPSTLEVYEFGHESITPSEAELFVEHATIGDVRIGKVEVARSFLASYKDNEYVELYEPIHGWGVTTTSPPVARNGAHHFFHYSARLYGGGMAYESPGWAVTEVAEDGRFNELVTPNVESPPGPESGGMWWSLNQAEPITNKTFTEFGFRGIARENEGEQEATLRWRWDTKKKVYTMLDWKMGPRQSRQ